MEITRWVAAKLGVRDLPSIRVVKSHRSEVLKLAGSQPQVLKSAIGNLYCKTSLARILAHVSTFLPAAQSSIPIICDYSGGCKPHRAATAGILPRR